MAATVVTPRPAMHQKRPYPQVIVTHKAARSLAGGHPWVFAGEVLRVEPAPSDGRACANGDIVDVREENGTYQGTGLISEQSKIRVRVLSRNANDRFDDAFWARKLAWAWEYRTCVMGARALPGCEPDTNCCRLLFSEADGFAGLVVDRYEDVLVSQVGTVGMERLRPTIYPLMLDMLRRDGQDVSGIYERCDTPSRDLEGLPRRVGWWPEEGMPTADIAAPPSARRVVRENGIAYDLDLEHSQKTGFFLDQKYNRRAVRDIAGGRRVLDCFCHVGPFGLNAAAGGATFVRGVDVSQGACDLATENARINGLDDRMGFSCANVLEYLPELRADKARLAEEGGPFDLIVLDPPAFTKSRGTADHAAKGYREVNYAALRLLPRGGYLATCSCSHFMPASRLAQVVAEAAHDANVQLKQVEERQQAPDHPILLGVPETDYLKFFIFQVV
ncbi:MAG: class I SAM-dependent rRNA methyltransferase [Atopobiaceae bacterium]|nr:class I SAM-dependent rRNA methyltransferase [Atopobiaceae bacterium]